METKFKIIIPGKNSRLIFLETTSFATALRGASAMGGYVQRTSDGKYYQDDSFATGQVWVSDLQTVIEYTEGLEEDNAIVEAMIQAYRLGEDLGDVA
jgi:hypothetical protein